jgi:hypothetical protein
MLLLQIGVEPEVLLPFYHGERGIERVKLDNLDIAGIKLLPAAGEGDSSLAADVAPLRPRATGDTQNAD